MNLVWLRRDLRIEDNSALVNAVETGEPVVCIYTATPETWHEHGLAPIQADLIYRRLQGLKQDLSLYVFHCFMRKWIHILRAQSVSLRLLLCSVRIECWLTRNTRLMSSVEMPRLKCV